MGDRIPNAPVYYVLAQVLFNPVDAMATSYVPAIQDEFRKSGYDERSQETMQLYVVEPTNMRMEFRPRWHFFNRDHTVDFVLTNDFLVVQTTAYDTIDTFLPLIEKGLSIVHSIVKLSTVKTQGLRYLNALCTDSMTEMENIVHRGLLGLDHYSHKLEQTKFEMLTQTKIGPLIANVVCQDVAGSGALLPPEMLPTPLVVNDRFHNFTGKLCIIDMDQRALDIGGNFDIHEIIDRFREMNHYVRATFNDIVNIAQL